MTSLALGDRPLKRFRTSGAGDAIPPENLHWFFVRDHSFDMRDMPDWWLDGFGRSHGKLETGSGRWELASADSIWQVWVVRLHFPSFETSVHLYHQHAPFLIFVRVGDPDIGDAMFFERSKTGLSGGHSTGQDRIQRRRRRPTEGPAFIRCSRRRLSLRPRGRHRLWRHESDFASSGLRKGTYATW